VQVNQGIAREEVRVHRALRRSVVLLGLAAPVGLALGGPSQPLKAASPFGDARLVMSPTAAEPPVLLRAQFGASSSLAEVQFVDVPDFPANNGRGAPDYGWIDITGVAVGVDGRVYMCQGTPSRYKVLVFDSAGNYLTNWGRGILEEPHACRVDSQGNLWFTDFNTHVVTKFSPEGVLLATYGVAHRPGRTPGHFSGPNDVAFGPSGDIYVAEGDGDRVSHLAPDGTYINSWGRRGKAPGRFRYPHSIAVDAEGRVYVADRQNKRIQVFSSDGQFLAQWRGIGTPFNLLVTPTQELLVADGKRGTLSLYNLSGGLLARWGRGSSGPSGFDEPHGLAMDVEGALYVADAGERRIRKFAPVP
jgi:DNA-binding beta-propeller fold protein YncE